MHSTIQSFLKQYLHNLEKSELSLWSGTLDLKNIMLNEDAMDSVCGFSAFNLSLSSSFIDKVNISIPIRDFLSAPMHIKANSLYATLSFTSGDKSKKPEEQKVTQLEEKKVSKSGASNREDQKRSNSLGNSTELYSASTQSISSSTSPSQQSSDQEESIIASMKSKLTQNINIELAKGKIILFSDNGFDLVLKIKNMHLINNKNYYHDELDPEYEQCDIYMCIGNLSLAYYESSLKKTNKFSILEYSNIKLFSFNQLKQYFRKLYRFPETLEVRLNEDIYKKLCLIWNQMTQQISNHSQTEDKGLDKSKTQTNSDYQALKYETEFDYNHIQIMILDVKGHNTGNLKYIGDIQKFKLQLNYFASVFKQIYSFSSVEFKYHSAETDNYSALLSVLTSNLFTMEIQTLHQKMEYTFKADEMIIRLFKLDESLKFFSETFTVMDDIRQELQLTEVVTPGEVHASSSQTLEKQMSSQRPKISLQLNQVEIELIDEQDFNTSKLAFQMIKINGFENQQLKKAQVNFRKINFKVFDYYLINGIEIKYIFDEKSQLINTNRIPIEVDIIQLNQLIQMNLMRDIDSFFKIISLIIQQSSEPNPLQIQASTTQDMTPMPQEAIETNEGKAIQTLVQIQCNSINVSIGYRHSKDFNEILGIDMIHPRIKIKGQKVDLSVQFRSHAIERMTLQKIQFIDKLKVTMKRANEQTIIEANNFKLNVFPETIREIKRISNIIETSCIPLQSRFQVSNKTMKIIRMLPINKNQGLVSNEILIKQYQRKEMRFIDFNQQYLVRFETQAFEQSDTHNYDFQISMQQLYYQFYQQRFLSEKGREYFFMNLNDLEHYAQFVLFVDCSNEDVLSVTFLERYAILNKISPGLKVLYSNLEPSSQALQVNLMFPEKKERNMIQMIDSISASFQNIKNARLQLDDKVELKIEDIYLDKCSDCITIPFQILQLPKGLNDQFEIIVLLPFMTIQNRFSSSLDSVIRYNIHKAREMNLTFESQKIYNLYFYDAVKDARNKSQKISTKVLNSLTFQITQAENHLQAILDFKELGQGLSNLEFFSLQDSAKSQYRRLSIEQSYEDYNYFKDQLDVRVLEQSSKIVPIKIQIIPTIVFQNCIAEDVYLLIHHIQDQNNDHLGNNIEIAQPNSTLEINSHKEDWIYYFQVGIKVLDKLILSQKILTLRNQTHYLVLNDGTFCCLLKVEVEFDKVNIKIKVKQAFKIFNRYSLVNTTDSQDLLVLLQSGKEFQQIVINDKNILYRFQLREDLPIGHQQTLAHINEQVVPEEAKHLLPLILQQMQIELKFLEQKNLEHYFVISDQLSRLLKLQPFDIILKSTASSQVQKLAFSEQDNSNAQQIINQSQFKNIGLELSFNEEEKDFQLEIHDSSLTKVSFEIINNCEDISFNFDLSSDLKLQLQNLQTIQFSSERDIKELLKQSNWRLRYEVHSQNFNIIQIKREDQEESLEESKGLEIDLNPEQLVDKDSVKVASLNVKLRSKANVHYNNQPINGLIQMDYIKLSKRHIALRISYIALILNEQKTQSYQIATNIDIKISFLPFTFQRNLFESHLFQISMQEVNLSLKTKEEQKQVDFSISSISVQNYDMDQCQHDQSQQNQQIQQANQQTILSMEDGFLVQMNIKPHSDSLQIIEDFKLNVLSEIHLMIDEVLKFQIAGFLSQLSTYDEVNSTNDREEDKLTRESKVRKYLIKNFETNEVTLILSLNLQSKVNIQIERANISFEGQVIRDNEREGEIIDFVNQALGYMTTQTFYSLHKLLYHSNFMGKLPSIYDEAKKGFINTLQGPYKMFAMFPMMNIAAKGMFKFIYTISASFGSNIIKFAVRSGMTDKENFIQYMDHKFSRVQSNWFRRSLSTMNQYQVKVYFNLNEDEKVLLYFDECFIDIESKNLLCHLMVLSHSIIIIYESYFQIKLLQFSYNHIRKFSFLQSDQFEGTTMNEYVKLQIGLKKRAMAKINENYFQIMNSSLNLEIPRRLAEAMLSALNTLNLVLKQSKK